MMPVASASRSIAAKAGCCGREMVFGPVNAHSAAGNGSDDRETRDRSRQAEARLYARLRVGNNAGFCHHRKMEQIPMYLRLNGMDGWIGSAGRGPCLLLAFLGEA